MIIIVIGLNYYFFEMNNQVTQNLASSFNSVAVKDGLQQFSTLLKLINHPNK